MATLNNGVKAVHLNDVNSAFPLSYYIDERGRFWYQGTFPPLLQQVLPFASGLVRIGDTELPDTLILALARKSPAWDKVFGGETKSKTFAEAVAQDKQDKRAKPCAAATPGNYVIAAVRKGVLDFAQVPVIHTSKQSAVAELERLAKLHPDTAFVACKIDVTARAELGVAFRGDVE